jgi:hypothetical protein
MPDRDQLSQLRGFAARGATAQAAVKPGRRDEMAYGARSLSHLWLAIAFVMDAMADKERPLDEAPPVSAFVKPAK